jgi:Protein of unknown function (DUF1153)
VNPKIPEKGRAQPANFITSRAVRPFVSRVLGPDGGVLTLVNMPPRGTVRWIARRKAEVVAGVRGGLLSFGDACERYALTSEELIAWQQAIARSGVNGLHATHLRTTKAGSSTKE